MEIQIFVIPLTNFYNPKIDNIIHNLSESHVLAL